MKVTCEECNKRFDLTDTKQAADYYGGHDCEEGDN